MCLRVERATQYLKQSQLPNGGFKSCGNDNANSVATVISGLVAAGEDVKSSKWSQNGNSMLDALMRFKLEDGSFSYLVSSDKYNPMSTYQAFIAISDVQRGESIWHSLQAEWLAKVEDKKETEIDTEENTEINTEEESRQISSKADKQSIKSEVPKQEAKPVEKQNKNTVKENRPKEETQVQKPKKEKETPTKPAPQKSAEQNSDKSDSEKENKVRVQVKVTGNGGKIFYSGTVSLEREMQMHLKPEGNRFTI